MTNFCRTFGITIGVTTLQNTLKHRLPSALLFTFPDGAEISYAIIPYIHTLPEPLRSEVRRAFAVSVSNIWYTGVALSGLGLLVSLPATSTALHLFTDEYWGLEAGDLGVKTIPEQAHQDTELRIDEESIKCDDEDDGPAIIIIRDAMSLQKDIPL